MNLGLYALIVIYDTYLVIYDTSSPDGISKKGLVSKVLLVYAASALVDYPLSGLRCFRCLQFWRDT